MAFDEAVAAVLDEHAVELVCLAGYMRVLSPEFVRRYPGAILNVHPALLPAFPGLHAQRQALEHGVRVAGATVHLVDEGVDTGPIVLQAAVPVLADDTEETLTARILVEEHRLYPEAIRLFAEGRVEVSGRRVRFGEGGQERRSAMKCRSGPPRCSPSPTRRAWSTSPGGWPTWGSSSCRPGGPPGRSRPPGSPVREVADVTGFPEMLDGRVKTLHPAIHGGILARRDLPAHEEALARHGIGPIDLVAVNLYPFEKTVAQPGVPFDDAVEQIDVGGPAMIRAAAKNHAGVVVLVDPIQYAPVLEELRRSGGTVSADTRRRLALEAFRRTAQYDAAIATWLRAPGPSATPATADPLRFPPVIRLEAERVTPLRYGENPHQQAAFYRPLGPTLGIGGLGALRQLHGPELSYNNLLDLAGGAGPAPRVHRARRRRRQAHEPLRGRRRVPTSWPPSSAPARPIPSRSTAGSSA